MKILVTGGTGYIGSVAIRRLMAAGHEISVFDNVERGHRESLPAGVPLVVGDLRDASAIRSAMAAAKPDAVMHFAAYALVGESMRQPELYFGNNVVGGVNLLEAMRECGVGRIVFSSSCATYGEPGTDLIDETTPQKPTNPYGESKLMFEKMLAWYAKLHGLGYVALRYFNACGATDELGEDHRVPCETHVIPLVLRVALGQEPKARIFGDDYATPDGTCIRDYVHVSDLADAHLRAIESSFTGALNLGTGHGYSVKEIVESARRVTAATQTASLPALAVPRKSSAGRPPSPRSTPSWKRLGSGTRSTQMDTSPGSGAGIQIVDNR